MSEPNDIAENLARVKDRVAAAHVAAVDPAPAVTLVAISKTMAADRIRAALDAGHRVFGENRVQEAEDKWPDLKAAFPDTVLHLVGPLQSNKARRAVELFEVIETVDRPKLARALARLMDETGHRPQCLIQVNTGEEPQKAGVLPGDVDAFVA
ncbi:MAG: YggS family pyridoxal phosphate-dependent enzyme, partial [Rhodobacterales bacterium]|nr:YggS family pyridoxal phosphate-dependent enzyme [Rhodobacterales bacterium]